MKTAVQLIALTLMLGAVATSSQALAANKKMHDTRRGHAAYARAIGGVETEAGEGGMSASRTKALHDCSTEMNKLVQKDWGVMQNTDFAACMTQHGEAP